MVVILDKKLKKAVEKAVTKKMALFWKQFWNDKKNVAEFEKFMRT